jgi:hypothetical protein
VDWPNFFAGIAYSAVPKAWRRSWRPSSTVDFRHSAVFSGLLELAISLCLLALGYFRFLVIRSEQLRAAAGANQGTQLYFFVLVSIEYIFRPVSIILIGFVLDGAIRSWAAFFTDEIVPCLPLGLVAAIRKWTETRQQAKLLESAEPDLVEGIEEAGCALRICSQYPKDGWRIPVTIALEDKLYEIAEVKKGTASHPFMYLLRALPAGAVIRGLQRYDPPRRS